ncbi:MAG: AzlD domain-containing protein [Ilumatobacteraceae bacterium]
MTWTLVVMLAAGAYACKAVGFFVLGRRALPPALERCLALIPAAVVSALVMKDTFSTGQDLVIDARVAGVAAATIAVWKRAPFVAVIVIAAGVTAGVRAFS